MNNGVARDAEYLVPVRRWETKGVNVRRYLAGERISVVDVLKGMVKSQLICSNSGMGTYDEVGTVPNHTT